MSTPGGDYKTSLRTLDADEKGVHTVPTRAVAGLDDDEKNTLHIVKGGPG